MFLKTPISRLASLALLGLLAWAAQAGAQAAPQTITLAYLYSDGNIPVTLRAYKALLKERPDLQGKVKLELLTESMFDAVKAQDMTSANVLVFDTMNEKMLSRFDTTHKVELLDKVRQHGQVFAVGTGLLPKAQYTDKGVLWDDTARAYWEQSGFENQLALMKYVLTRAGVKGLKFPPPQRSLDFGYYYSDGESGRVFPTWQAFDTWRKAHGKVHPGAPRIAIGFYKSTYYTGDTALLNALIAEIEKQGGEAIPVFGYPGGVTFQKLLLDPQGHPRADAALGMIFNFSDFEASKALSKVDIPVINAVALYGRSAKEWRESKTGLTQFEGTMDIDVPELAGTIAPTVVGSKEKHRDALTGVTAVLTEPIAPRVRMAVSRAMRYAELRKKPNAEKHIALLFYNYPPGKANIGASYLNVAESMSTILQRLKAEGYDLGDAKLDADSILADVLAKARNIGVYAPGELQTMLEKGSAIRISAAQYRQWLEDYPKQLRDKIIKDWGPPEKARLMTVQDKNGLSFIMPVVRYGNVVLMPQPARGWGVDLEKLYHAKDLAPPHQYVAAYTWLRKGFQADAVIHLGTHGTLEWLDGKDIGLTENDAPDALEGDLPNINIYNVDVVGEGLVARRRGMATLVDHMVPAFKKGGLTPELAKLSETINDYDVNESKAPKLAATYAENIRKQAIALGISKDLELDLNKGPMTDALVEKVEDYLIDLKGQNIPYGLHTFGVAPAGDALKSTVEAIVDTDRSLLPSKAKVLTSDMTQRIVSSGPGELDSLVRALAGGFIPTGSGGEPIRNPDSYPTGRDFYGVDPDKVPKPASWELGVKLAKQMLADHLKRDGHYPQKVSFVIWGDETMRNEGVLESQIFYLLGTKPIWNARGKVVGVQVIPRSQLDHPRIDIVIASAAEGMFNNVTRLMDEAVQKVKVMDEADNLVRQHYLETKAALIKMGYSEKDAAQRAGVRIFDEPPGTYDLNTAGIASASGSWDSDKGMANDYISKMGYGYGNGFWGVPMQDVFRLALSGTDEVVHSSSTSLYGALDNDDMFMYVGGLANAIHSIDGKTPDITVANTRNPGKPEMTSMNEFIGKEFRSRYVNPTWIKGMEKEGYAGAGEMRAFVEYLWGWNATVPSLIDGGMWKQTFDVYVEDKYHLDLKKFFDTKSPFAYQSMVARMVETIRKGYWHPDEKTRNKLLSEYVASVDTHGVDCTENTCGNPRLLKYVLDEGKAAGIAAPQLEAFKQRLEKAMGKQIAPAAAAEAAFAKNNDAREEAESQQAAARRLGSTSETAPAPQTSKAAGPAEAQGGKQAAAKGYVMEQEDRSPEKKPAQPAASVHGESWEILWVAVPTLCLLLLWRTRRRRGPERM